MSRHLALTLTVDERAELERRTRGRKLRAEDARRARVILMLADGLSFRTITDATGCYPDYINRWRQRFEDERLPGLAAKYRGQPASVRTPAMEARILAKTRQAPPDGSTHWSTRTLAKVLGVRHVLVARVWRRAGLQPRRLERSRLSDDPAFEEKAADIIGLYLNPPEHAAVFAADEKTAIQALDRLDPVLPLSPGRAERHGFEYYRHGTLSLHAALNTRTGEIVGQTVPRHTSDACLTGRRSEDPIMSTEITRRSFFQTSLAASGMAAAPAVRRGAERGQNVLFIQADDLCNRLGCYGYPVKSPNIDRLARSGVRFDRAYCQYSLCAPSRASVMTGLAPDTTRVWDLRTDFRKVTPNVMTIPQAFKANGYFAGRSGKIYHYNNPSEVGTPGFDDPTSWDETHNPAGADRMHDEALVTWIVQRGANAGRPGTAAPAPAGPPPQAGPGGQAGTPTQAPGRGGSGVRISQDGVTPILPLSQNGDLGVAMAYHRSAFPDRHHTDYLVADEAIDMMEKHRKEPWFIGAGFFKPHVPWIVPSQYFDMYKLEDMDVPPFNPNETTGAPGRPLRRQTLTDQQHRQAMLAYYASTTFMDAQVGRLLDALKRLGMAENTIIVFWGDNGFALGEHGLWQKSTVFEAAARVPLVWAGPGTKAIGAACGRTVESMDIYPTLMELCGVKNRPTNLQGKSLVPLLTNPLIPWDRPAITQLQHGKTGGYSMRTERYRYTLWMAGGEELYDYETDPREERNLADDSSAADVKAKLRARLEQVIRSRGFTEA